MVYQGVTCQILEPKDVDKLSLLFSDQTVGISEETVVTQLAEQLALSEARRFAIVARIAWKAAWGLVSKPGTSLSF